MGNRYSRRFNQTSYGKSWKSEIHTPHVGKSMIGDSIYRRTQRSQCQESHYQISYQNNHESQIIIKILFPSYYSSKPLTSEDYYRTLLTWEEIAKGTSAEYSSQKQLGTTLTCREWFNSVFYYRLFFLDSVSINLHATSSS